MSSQLRFAVENRKRHLIDELIGAGVFKIRDRQLYELSLEELEKSTKIWKIMQIFRLYILVKESWLRFCVASSLLFRRNYFCISFIGRSQF